MNPCFDEPLDTDNYGQKKLAARLMMPADGMDEHAGKAIRWVFRGDFNRRSGSESTEFLRPTRAVCG